MMWRGDGCPAARTTIRWRRLKLDSKMRQPLGLDDPRLAQAAQTRPDVREFPYWSRMPHGDRSVDGQGLPRRDQRFTAPALRTARVATFLVPLDKRSEFITARAMSTRGEHLVRADRGFATGGGAACAADRAGFPRCSTRSTGVWRAAGIELTFPSGDKRRLGFHATGPKAVVRLSSWLALVRLAASGSVGWYKAWALGEWSSPDPVPLFELFSANAVPLGDVGRAKGPFRWVNALAHRLRDNAPRKARENIAAHYDLGNDFYAAWLDATMTYSARRASRRPTTASSMRSCARSTRCSTGSTSSRASACSRSAAAGARWRSRPRSAARRSSG